MIDYKKRYQTIKNKGAELSLSISSYLDKEYYLGFKNSYYGNFRDIPLEDYINLIKREKEDISFYPLISYNMEGIEPIEEGEEYHALGYKITYYLRLGEGYEWDNTTEELNNLTKEKVSMRRYLPLELSYLFNTHKETSIEDTLSRYIKAVFNTPLDEKEIKEEISHSFNKYALVFAMEYGGGYLKHPTYKKPSLEDEDFKTKLIKAINNEKETINQIENDTKEQREKILSSSGELLGHYATPFNSDDTARNISIEIFNTIETLIKDLSKEGNTPKECILYDDIAYKEIIKQTPNEEGAIYPLTLTSSEDSYLRLLCIYLNLIISNNRVVEQKREYIKALETALNDDELLEDLSYRYLFMLTGEIKRAIFKRNKPLSKPDIEINPHFISGSEPTLEMIKGLQVAVNQVNSDEEIAKIEKYQSDYRLKAQLEKELKTLQSQLTEEQQINGYKTAKGKELQERIQDIASQLDKLDLDSRGKSEYAPFNYMILDNRYMRIDNLALRSYQVSSTQSVVIVNDRTSLKAPNNVIASYNALTTGVLLFLIATMIYQNDRTITLTNEEIEKFILKDNYDKASLKDRDNARNIYFMNALNLLVETTIITSYEPSKTASAKGKKRRAKTSGRGSLIRYTNYYNHIEITLDKEIYETAIEDFQKIPLHPRAYDLRPRAFITAYYLSNLFAFNVRGKQREQKISIDKLIENNGAYAINLKSLKDNPKRLFIPILEDFEEMIDKDILSYYEPSIDEYKGYKMRLKTSDMITFIFNATPQASKKKKGK